VWPCHDFRRPPSSERAFVIVRPTFDRTAVANVEPAAPKNEAGGTAQIGQKRAVERDMKRNSPGQPQKSKRLER